MPTLVALGLLAGSSWAFGTMAISPLRWPALLSYERWALRLLLGLGTTALLLSLLALTRLFGYAPLVLSSVTAAGALMTVRGVVSAPKSSPIPMRIRNGTVAGAAIIVTAIVGCLGAVAPVTDDDALAYVVPIAKHIAASASVAVWPDQARSMWPQSQQVMLAFLIRMGSDRLGALTAFEWLLCIGAVSALARTVCRRKEDVATALILALGAPVIAFQIASAKEDLLVVAATAATGLCLSTAASANEFAVAGLFAGIAAAAKYPGIAVAGAAVLFPIVQRRKGWVVNATLVAVGAAGTGGLWYGVNLWRYGNPVAPFIWGASGTPLDAAVVRDFVDAYGINKSAIGMVTAPFRIFLQPALFCGRANLFNPLVYIGVVALWIRESRHRYAALLFLSGVLYVAWFFTLQNARFLLPAAVLLAPAAADVIVPWIHSRPLRVVAWGTALVSLGVVAAVGSLRIIRYVQAPDRFLDRETQNYADIVWMNANLDPQRDRVASDHKALAHLEIPWLFLDPTYQLEISGPEMADAGRLLEACRRQHITHLFGRTTSFAPLRDHLRIVYQNPDSRLGGVRFFRTPPSEATAVFEITDAHSATRLSERR